MGTKGEKRPVSAALGIFDGVHRGHAAVIGQAVSDAEKKGYISGVCTFRTASVDTKGGEYAPIYSDETKTALIKELGVEYIYMADFGDIKNMSGEDFVKKILIGVMNAGTVVCGGDFRFGKGASCGREELESICRDNNIDVIVADDVTEENVRISSADIRRLIRSGDIKRVNFLLGHNYTVSGKIIQGNRFGRTMDFPTANQKMDVNAVMPKFGVYASFAEIDGRVYRGVTNIGVKPTLDSSGIPLAETHFPGFKGDIYGKDLNLRLAGFVRPEMKFPSSERLREQILSDVKTVMDMPAYEK